jgi:hypothetical protein
VGFSREYLVYTVYKLATVTAGGSSRGNGRRMVYTYTNLSKSRQLLMHHKIQAGRIRVSRYFDLICFFGSFPFVAPRQSREALNFFL